MLLSPLGGIGRHKGLKIPRLKSRAGSSPAAGTIRLEVIISRICTVFAYIMKSEEKMNKRDQAIRHGK